MSKHSLLFGVRSRSVFVLSRCVRVSQSRRTGQAVMALFHRQIPAAGSAYGKLTSDIQMRVDTVLLCKGKIRATPTADSNAVSCERRRAGNIDHRLDVSKLNQFSITCAWASFTRLPRRSIWASCTGAVKQQWRTNDCIIHLPSPTNNHLFYTLQSPGVRSSWEGRQPVVAGYLPPAARADFLTVTSFLEHRANMESCSDRFRVDIPNVV
jgi:hypothetical protein